VGEATTASTAPKRYAGLLTASGREAAGQPEAREKYEENQM